MHKQIVERILFLARNYKTVQRPAILRLGMADEFNIRKKDKKLIYCKKLVVRTNIVTCPNNIKDTE
jgi:hypothetical protein